MTDVIITFTLSNYCFLQMASSSGISREMAFHEMALLQTEFQLDEVKECVQILQKNKAMIDAELNEKVKLQYELDAKAKRYKKF